MKDKLLEYWLSKKEVNIYLTSLEYWAIRIWTLARVAKENRVTTYSVCENLEKKGLCHFLIKNKVKYFETKSPHSLVQSLEKKKNAILEIIPTLLLHEKEKEAKVEIKHFEWILGLEDLYLDMLQHQNTEIKTIIWPDNISPSFKDFLDHKFIPLRTKKNIKAKVLMPKTKLNKSYKKDDKRFLRKTKLIEDKVFDIHSEINLYGNYKVSFAMFGDEEMTGMIVTSKQLHTTLSSIFNLMRKL